MKCISFVLFTFFINSSGTFVPIVYTNKGAVKGIESRTIWYTSYYTFWGIPYAKPPLGERRFMPPEEMDDWNEIKDATRMKPSCETDEDCLFLNVFTPFLPISDNKSNNQLLPVMLWIHGGSFNIGSGTTEEEHPEFFMEENVVWVSFNYRLGVFGFLNSRQLNISGNAGMKDQVEVLKWVRRNIHKFGGDCNKVTLIGWSAGSTSVHYHMMSPLSQGLFHGAIMHSGSSLNPWAFTTDGDEISNYLCNDLFEYNCSVDNLEMLQQESMRTLLNFDCFQSKTFIGIYPYCFVPNIDGTFLIDQPLNILKDREITQVPLMIGFTSFEGNVYNNLEQLEQFTFEILLKTCMANSMNFTRNNFSEILNKLRDHVDEGNDEILVKYAKFDTECMVTHGVFKTVDIISKKFGSATENPYPIYFYQFSFDGNFNFHKISNGLIELPGASHGDDLGYLFRNMQHKNSAYTTSSKELLTLKRMIKMWTNFAKTRNPTPEITELLPVQWLPVTSETNYMLNIDEELTLIPNSSKPFLDFYSQFYDY